MGGRGTCISSCGRVFVAAVATARPSRSGLWKSTILLGVLTESQMRCITLNVKNTICAALKCEERLSELRYGGAMVNAFMRRLAGANPGFVA